MHEDEQDISTGRNTPHEDQFPASSGGYGGADVERGNQRGRESPNRQNDDENGSEHDKLGGEISAVLFIFLTFQRRSGWLSLEARYTFLPKELAIGLDSHPIHILDSLLWDIPGSCDHSASIWKEYPIRREIDARDCICSLRPICENNRTFLRLGLCCVPRSSTQSAVFSQSITRSHNR
jgi:hypothetical protein